MSLVLQVTTECETWLVLIIRLLCAFRTFDLFGKEELSESFRISSPVTTLVSAGGGKREMLALKHTFALATFSDQIKDFRPEIVPKPVAFPEV